MPEEAASEMIATRFAPLWKLLCSCTFALSTPLCPLLRAANLNCEPTRTKRWLRPVISATQAGPPKWAIKLSRGFGGNRKAFRRSLKCWAASAAHSTGRPPRSVVGKCTSNRCSRIISGPDTSSPTASPVARCRSLCFILASCVDHKLSTTASPDARAARVSRTASGTLDATKRLLKNCCCAAQKKRLVEGAPRCVSSLASRGSFAAWRNAVKTSLHKAQAASYCSRSACPKGVSTVSKLAPWKDNDLHDIAPKDRSLTAKASAAAKPPRSRCRCRALKEVKEGWPRPQSPKRLM
mmetsp:Transcript_150538/g.484013  ORF Transcript_150538/g.484013 Transcript_150538/m.484013 type:complete len:295 (-) Transcript_150538:376-1260(-)